LHRECLPNIVTISGKNGLGDVGENIALNKYLCAFSSINTGVYILEVRVIDVSGAESKTWSTRANVEPVVVVLGDVQVSSIFGAVRVRVSDERCLEMIMEIGVGNSNPFRGVSDINETVIIILAVVKVGR
jgi:proteasome assembly chaperone (PAC2) family protein